MLPGSIAAPVGRRATLPELRRGHRRRSTTSCCDCSTSGRGWSRRWARSKARLKQPFYVPERERQIVERLRRRNSGPFPDRGAPSGLLRDHQRLPVARAAAARGLPRARGDLHAHGGAQRASGCRRATCRRRPSAGVFAEVEKGLADLGVVPIENSTEGVVNSTLDVFMDSELSIPPEIVTAGEPLPADALGHARRACRRSIRTRRRWRSAATGCRRTCPRRR